MSCPFRSIVPTKIESFITVSWCGVPIEAGGNPGYGIVGCVSRDEGVTDALQHLESDPVPVSAKRVYVGCVTDGRTKRSVVPCAMNAGTSDSNGPGEFWESNSCQGSMVARSRTVRNWASTDAAGRGSEKCAGPLLQAREPHWQDVRAP
jgi:hypothetical protein